MVREVWWEMVRLGFPTRLRVSWRRRKALVLWRWRCGGYGGVVVTTILGRGRLRGGLEQCRGWLVVDLSDLRLSGGWWADPKWFAGV